MSEVCLDRVTRDNIPAVGTQALCEAIDGTWELEAAPAPQHQDSLPPVEPRPVAPTPPDPVRVLTRDETLALARLVFENPSLAWDSDGPFLDLFVEEVKRLFGITSGEISEDIERAVRNDPALRGLIRWSIEQRFRRVDASFEHVESGATPAAFPVARPHRALTAREEIIVRAALASNVPRPLAELFLQAFRAGDLRVTVDQNDDRDRHSFRVTMEIDGEFSVVVDSQTRAAHAAAAPDIPQSPLGRLGVVFLQRMLVASHHLNPGDYTEGRFCGHSRDALYQYLAARNLLNPSFHLPSLARMLEQRLAADDEAYALFQSYPAPGPDADQGARDRYAFYRFEQIKEALNRSFMLMRFASQYANMQLTGLSEMEIEFVNLCRDIVNSSRARIQELFGLLFDRDGDGREQGLFRLALSSLDSALAEIERYSSSSRQRDQAVQGFVQEVSGTLSMLYGWRSMAEDDAALSGILDQQIRDVRGMVLIFCPNFPVEERRFIEERMAAIPLEVAAELERQGLEDEDTYRAHTATQRRYVFARQLSDSLGAHPARGLIVGVLRQQARQRDLQDLYDINTRMLGISASLETSVRANHHGRISASVRGERYHETPYLDQAWRTIQAQERIRMGLGDYNREAQGWAYQLVSSYYSVLEQTNRGLPGLEGYTPEERAQIVSILQGLGLMDEEGMLNADRFYAMRTDERERLLTAFLPAFSQERAQAIVDSLQPITLRSVIEETQELIQLIQADPYYSSRANLQELLGVLGSVGNTSEDQEVAQLDLELEGESRLHRTISLSAPHLLAGSQMVFTPEAMAQMAEDASERTFDPELRTYQQMQAAIQALPPSRRSALRHQVDALGGHPGDYYLISPDQIILVTRAEREALENPERDLPVRSDRHLAGRRFRMMSADLAHDRPDAFLNVILLSNFGGRDLAETVLGDPEYPPVYAAINGRGLTQLVTLFGETDLYSFPPGQPSFDGMERGSIDLLARSLRLHAPAGIDGQQIGQLLQRALMGSPYILFSSTEYSALLAAVRQLAGMNDAQLLEAFPNLRTAEQREAAISGLDYLLMALERMVHREGLNETERANISTLGTLFARASDLPEGSAERVLLEAGICDHLTGEPPSAALTQALAHAAERAGITVADPAALYVDSVRTLQRLVRSLQFQSAAMPPEEYGYEWSTDPGAAAAHYIDTLFRSFSDIGRVQSSAGMTVGGLPAERNVWLVALAHPEYFRDLAQVQAALLALEQSRGRIERSIIPDADFAAVASLFVDASQGTLVFRPDVDEAATLAAIERCEVSDATKRILRAYYLGYRRGTQELQRTLRACVVLNRDPEFVAFRTELQRLARRESSTALGQPAALRTSDPLMPRVTGAFAIIDRVAGLQEGDGQRPYISSAASIVEQTALELGNLDRDLATARRELEHNEHGAEGSGRNPALVPGLRRRVATLERIRVRLVQILERFTALRDAWETIQPLYAQKTTLERQRRDLVFRIQNPRIDRDFYDRLVAALPAVLGDQADTFWQRVAESFTRGLMGTTSGVSSPAGHDPRPPRQILSEFFAQADSGFYLTDLYLQGGEDDRLSQVRLAFTAVINELPSQVRANLAAILPALAIETRGPFSPMMLGPVLGLSFTDLRDIPAGPDSREAVQELTASPAGRMWDSVVRWASQSVQGEYAPQDMSASIQGTIGRSQERGDSSMAGTMGGTAGRPADRPLPSDRVTRLALLHFFEYMISDLTPYVTDPELTPVIEDELARRIQTTDLRPYLANNGEQLLRMVGAVSRTQVLRIPGAEAHLDEIFLNSGPDEPYLLFREGADALIRQHTTGAAQSALLALYQETERTRERSIPAETEFRVFDSAHAAANWEGDADDFEAQQTLSRITESYFRLTNFIYQQNPLDNPEFEIYQGMADPGRALGNLSFLRRHPEAGQAYRAVRMVEVIDVEPRYGEVREAVDILPGDLAFYPEVAMGNSRDWLVRYGGQMLRDGQEGWQRFRQAAEDHGWLAPETWEGAQTFISSGALTVLERGANFTAVMGSSIRLGYSGLVTELDNFRRAAVRGDRGDMETAVARMQKIIGTTTASFAGFESVPVVFYSQVMGMIEDRNYSGAFALATAISFSMLESFTAFAATMRTLIESRQVIWEGGRLLFSRGSDREVARAMFRQRLRELGAHIEQRRSQGLGARWASYHIPGYGQFLWGRDMWRGVGRSRVILRALRDPFSGRGVLIDPVRGPVLGPRTESRSLMGRVADGVIDTAVMAPRRHTLIQRAKARLAEMPGAALVRVFRPHGGSRMLPAMDAADAAALETSMRQVLSGEAQYVDIAFDRGAQLRAVRTEDTTVRVTRQVYLELLQARLNNDMVTFRRILNRERGRVGRVGGFSRWVTDGRISRVFAAFQDQVNALGPGARADVSDALADARTRTVFDEAGFFADTARPWRPGRPRVSMGDMIDLPIEVNGQPVRISRMQIMEILVSRAEGSSRTIVDYATDTAVYNHFLRRMGLERLQHALHISGRGPLWRGRILGRVGRSSAVGQLYFDADIFTPRGWGEAYLSDVAGYSDLRPAYRSMRDFVSHIPENCEAVRRYAAHHQVSMRQARAELAARVEQDFIDARSRAFMEVLDVTPGQTVSRAEARRRLGDPARRAQLRTRLGEIDARFAADDTGIGTQATTDRLNEILQREAVPTEVEGRLTLELRLGQLSSTRASRALNWREIRRLGRLIQSLDAVAPPTVPDSAVPPPADPAAPVADPAAPRPADPTAPAAEPVTPMPEEPAAPRPAEPAVDPVAPVADPAEPVASRSETFVGPERTSYTFTLRDGVQMHNLGDGQVEFVNQEGLLIARYELNEDGVLVRDTEAEVATDRASRRLARGLERERAPQARRAQRDIIRMRQYHEEIDRVGNELGLTEAERARLRQGEMPEMVREGLGLLGEQVTPELFLRRLATPEGQAWLQTESGRRFSEWMRSGESRTALSAGWRSFLMGIVVIVGVDELFRLFGAEEYLNAHPVIRFAATMSMVHLTNAAADPVMSRIVSRSGRVDLQAHMRALRNAFRLGGSAEAQAARSEAVGFLTARHAIREGERVTWRTLAGRWAGRTVGPRGMVGLARGVGMGFVASCLYDSIMALVVPQDHVLRGSTANLIASTGMTIGAEALIGALGIPGVGEAVAVVGVSYMAINMFYGFTSTSYAQSFDTRLLEALRSDAQGRVRTSRADSWLVQDGLEGANLLGKAGLPPVSYEDWLAMCVALGLDPNLAERPMDADERAAVLQAAEQLLYYGDGERSGDIEMSRQTRGSLQAQLQHLRRPGETQEVFEARVQRMLGHRVNFEGQQEQAYEFVRRALTPDENGRMYVQATRTETEQELVTTYAGDGAPMYSYRTVVRHVPAGPPTEIHGIYDPALRAELNRQFGIPLEGAPAGQGMGAFLDRVQCRMLQDQFAFLAGVRFGRASMQAVVEYHFTEREHLTGEALERRVDEEVARLAEENDDIRAMFDSHGVMREGQLGAVLDWITPAPQRVAFLMAQQTRVFQLVELAAQEFASGEPADLSGAPEEVRALYENVRTQYQRLVEPGNWTDPSETALMAVAGAVFSEAEFLTDSDRRYLGTDGLLDRNHPVCRQIAEAAARVEAENVVARYHAQTTEEGRRAVLTAIRIEYACARAANDEEAMARLAQEIEQCGDDLNWLEDEEYMLAMDEIVPQVGEIADPDERSIFVMLSLSRLMDVEGDVAVV